MNINKDKFHLISASNALIFIIFATVLFFGINRISDSSDHYLSKLLELSKNIDALNTENNYSTEDNIINTKSKKSKRSVNEQIVYIKKAFKNINFELGNIIDLKSNLLILMEGLSSENVLVRKSSDGYAFQLLTKRVNLKHHDDWLRLKITDEFFKVYKKVRSENIINLTLHEPESIELQYLSKI